MLDERALSSALADDPTVFGLLAAMTTATDERLRAAAIRLSASIVLERARAGRPPCAEYPGCGPSAAPPMAIWTSTRRWRRCRRPGPRRGRRPWTT